MAREIIVKCDHCGKDITCEERYRLNIMINKMASAKDYALGMISFNAGDNKEIDLCANCYRTVEIKADMFLRGGE